MVMDCAGYFTFRPSWTWAKGTGSYASMDTTRAGGAWTRDRGHGCGHGREEVTKFLPAAAR